MPFTEYTDEELGLSPGWDNELDPNIRRELRQARVTRSQNAELQAKVEEFERERVLTRAGIPNDKRGELFARTYEGEMTPEAIKAEYESLFGPAGEQKPAGSTTAGDQRIADAGAAGDSEGSPGTLTLEDAIKGAKSTKEVLEIIRNAPPEAGIRLSEDQ